MMQVDDMVEVFFDERREVFLVYMQFIDVRIGLQHGSKNTFYQVMQLYLGQLLFEAAHNGRGEYDIPNGA